jgi:hypothetical protein
MDKEVISDDIRLRVVRVHLLSIDLLTVCKTTDTAVETPYVVT